MRFHSSLASPQGLATFHRGSGPIAAIIVGAIASSITLIVGQIAFTTLRSPLIRAVIALLFVVPAAVAGYHAALGLAHVGIPADGWRQAVAVAGAIIVAVTAWERMVLSAPRPTPDKALPPA
jgi:succinate dehydrogenase/fumarate reductase cytochrome b subunit